MTRASDHHDQARIQALAANDGYAAVSRCGSVVAIGARFPETESSIANGAYLRIATPITGSAALFQRTEAGLIEANWRQGMIAVTLPGATGDSACAPVEVAGIAIDWTRFAGTATRDPARLAASASRLTNDPLAASLLVTLRHAAETHGCSTAFFEHGVSLLLDRLVPPTLVHQNRPLTADQFARVSELVHESLGQDLSVAEMAAAAGRERSGFSRAFRTSTGETPFAWLTARRMEHARLLLARGERVTDVALTVGYANASKFAAAFRRHWGEAPTVRRNLDRELGMFPVNRAM